jgi:IS4 transposase
MWTVGRKHKKPSNSVEPVPGSEDQVVGRRFIRLIEDQLNHLKSLPSHGNREVSFDQVVIAHLIAFFNPCQHSLRKIEDVFDDKRVRKRLGTPRLPKSTLADAQRVMDPELLKPIIEHLQERAQIQPHDKRLDQISREIIAADGSFFTVAPRIAWAIFNNSGKGNVKGHFQFNVLEGIPEQVSLTDGQTSEGSQLRAALRAGCFYVLDRGYQDYSLLHEIINKHSDFLVRLRKTAHLETVEELPLSATDQTAGIQSDRLVHIGSRKDQVAELPVLRAVEVSFTNRKGETETMLLITNRLDLPAWLIALVYQHRWQVELFFRWLKCTANFKHFLSESQQAMTLQVYVTMIGLLLIAIETGAKPSTYDFSLMSAAVSGLISMESALEIAAKRRAERARAAAWQKAYNARKKNAQ